MIVCCWRDGRIGFDRRRAPKGAMELVRGPGQRLRSVVEVQARHGWAKGVLLVPGIPEATTALEAAQAAKAFRDRVLKRLGAAEPAL